MDGRIDGWMYRWMDGYRMDEYRMDGWMDGWIDIRWI